MDGLMHARPRAPIVSIAVVLVIVLVIAGAAFYLSGLHPNPNSSSTVTTQTTLAIASTVTTSIGSQPKLNVAPPQPQSQIVRMDANTTVSDSGAHGGSQPYRYQWLGAVRNVSSNFTASYGDFLCLGSAAQSSTCNFQTINGYNSLIPGTYYLKLQASDSSSPAQIANSSVAYVNVIG